MKTIAYIRVSTTQQDLQNQKLEIYTYASNNQIMVDHFIEVEVSSQRTPKERKIEQLMAELKSGDSVIVSELSRLGRSVGQIIQIIDAFIKHEIKFTAIKEGIRIDGTQDLQTKVMVTLFGLFAEIERDLISERTKQGLAVAREKGRMLGRPKGRGRSKLDKHKEEIMQLLENGSTKVHIAKRFNCSYAALYVWLQHEGLLNHGKLKK